MSVEKKMNEYIFSVKDNGIGMEESYLKKIFSIFQRLNPREKYDGTGIGLSISLRILQQHKGKIWANHNLEMVQHFTSQYPLIKFNFFYSLKNFLSIEIYNNKCDCGFQKSLIEKKY